MNSNPDTLLSIDVGNSSTLMGLFHSDQLVSTVRLPTLKSASASEWQDKLSNSIHTFKLSSAVQIMGTSVVPEVNPHLEDYFLRNFQSSCRWVTCQDKFNFKLNIEQPQTIGTDRLVDAHAAVAEFGSSVIVVDMGTATTVDCVLDGVFEGGLILPGLEISAQALFGRTSKLFPVPLDKPKSFLGKNTHDCIQSGLVNGYALMLDAIIQKMRAELVDDLFVVSTGGLSQLMMDVSELIDHRDEFLTLKGLKSLCQNKP